MSVETTPLWEKPGPGAWQFDGAHSVGPVTRIVQDVFPQAMADGFRSFTGRYGLPISHIDVRYVNGYPYGSAQLAGIPASDRPPPPSWLLRVLTRVHPVMRARERTARAALARRVWNDDLRRWFDEQRPARIASVRALQAIEPAALDDESLATHVEECVSEFGAGLREHFSLVGAAGIPVGLHILRQAERGRSAAAAITDLTGAAAQTTAATVPALDAIAAALAAAGVEPGSVDDIRAASTDAAAALDAYLADYGQRVVGAFDVTGRRLVELPEVVLRSVAAARRDQRPTTVDPADDDVVAADARLALASRDDHAGICCMWTLGLLRRALLQAGRRLHLLGLVDQPEHVLEADGPEIARLLRGDTASVSATVLARRAGDRQRLAALDPPPLLGTFHPPPDPSVFPAAMRRMTAATSAFMAVMETSRVHGGSRGVGVGVGDGVHRGRAVVAFDPEDAITRLEPGDVLVTPTTTPAFNAVLPIAGALVTAHGGLLSHAGIASRELGIPAVLGVGDVMERIPDGADVEVDPVAGTVTVAPTHVAFGPGVRSPAMSAGAVGGKAAGMLTMCRLGLPVPPGVVLPVAFHRAASGDREGTLVADVVRAALRRLEDLTGRRLGDPEDPLIVSVRSGSPVSMPGMMDTLLDVGTTPEIAAGLARTTGDASFADDTLRRLLVGWAVIVDGRDAHVIEELAATCSAAELADRLTELGACAPADPIEQVIEAVRAVHRSWDSEHARAFRRQEGIDDSIGTAVTIQAMVFGNLGQDSGSGVVFSRDPSTGAHELVGDVLFNAQGEDVVGGGHRTSPLAAMAERWPDVHRQLVDAVDALERHHADVVDVEFTVERGQLYLLQCRPGRRTSAAALRMAVEMAEDPGFPLDRAAAVTRCQHLLNAPPAQPLPLDDAALGEHLLAAGLPASPGRGVGALVVTVEEALRRCEAGEQVVLARPSTSPADVAAFAVAGGVITSSGGLLSHAAVVARSWGLPAVVGASDLVVEGDGVRVGDRTISVGEVVTVDGMAGVLLRGAHPGRSAEPAELAVLRRWASELSAAKPQSRRPEPAADRSTGAEQSDLEVLRVVLLRGVVDIGTVATVLGASEADVGVSIERQLERGTVTRRGSGLTPTTAGRLEVTADVATVVAQHGSAFAVLLDRFHAPDRALKQLVTEHQLAPSDDAPALAGQRLARRLRREVHGHAVAIVADGARMVPRLARYDARLCAALQRLEGGDLRQLAHPELDSYHTVWFDLHEELIGLAGRERSE